MEFWKLYEAQAEENLLHFLKERCPYEGAKRSVWISAVEMLVKIDTVLSAELAAARFVLPVETCRLLIRKAVVNARLRMPDKFDHLVELESGVADVLLALVAGDQCQLILVEFMGVFTAVEILAYVYLLDGLYPIKFDDTIGYDDGILDELHTALSVEKSHELLVLMDHGTLRLPSYKSVLETIEAARSYLLGKQIGIKKAAEKIGIPESRVEMHRRRVNIKLKGLNWNFK